MADDDSVRDLIRKRGQCKAVLTRVQKWLEKRGESESSQDFVVRLELIDRAFIEFRDIEDNLLSYDNQTSEVIEFEERYLKIKALLRTYKDETDATVNSQLTDAIINLVEGQKSFLDQTLNNSTIRRDGIKLPSLNIPVFSGKYSDFPSFRDLFVTTIHDNDSLSNVRKFQYLKGLLQGEAEALIKHVAITDANYSETWEKLCKRYNKPKYVVTELIKRVVDQSSITNVCARTLRQMHNTIDEVIRGLGVLGEEAQTRDAWVIYLLIEKLDEETTLSWAKYSNTIEYPTIDNFLHFLNSKCDTLEACDITSKKATSKRLVNAVALQPQVNLCAKCDKDHFVMNCDEFKALTVGERRSLVATKSLCFNCLGATHRADKCKSRRFCNVCGRRHHTMLHQVNEGEQSNATGGTTATGPEDIKLLHTTTQAMEDNIKSMMSMHVNTKSHSLLPTALAYVKDSLGYKHYVRVLLDSGSEASFITEACWKKICTPRQNARLLLSGLATSNVTTKGRTKFTLYAATKTCNLIDVEALILDGLPSSVPSATLSEACWSKLQHLELADPSFNNQHGIDILIGADKFFDIVLGERIRIDNEGITAVNTIFGWLIVGRRNPKINSRATSSVNLHVQLDIEQTLRSFWEIEEVPDEVKRTPTELQCEEHFVKTVSRCSDGKFIVNLPFKDADQQLGQSLPSAVSRLLQAEKRFSRDPNLKHEYCKFMKEYLDLGHMKLIDSAATHNSAIYYLPHHAVVKNSSTTTKVRVVFDGSCKTTTGVSLNDKLLTGPTIQSTLYNILLRFRLHRFVISGDIEKMYRQIWVTERDRDFQRIVWREHPNMPIQHYQLLTVTYGTASAPFLATRPLQQLALYCQNDKPDISKRIARDFYVDDLLTGAETTDEASDIKQSITDILASAGFHLRKWRSNIRELNSCNLSEESIKFEIDDSVKILGLLWIPDQDIFSFNVEQ